MADHAKQVDDNIMASVAENSDRTEPEGVSAMPSSLVERLLPAGVMGLRPMKSPHDPARAANVPFQGNWSGLLDRIHTVGSHIRDVEAETVEQDRSVKELLEQVRLDMKAASDRVRAAEQIAMDIHERAIRQIMAAEDRADAAVASARSAQERFAALSRLIEQEFPSAKRSGADRRAS